MKITMTIEDKPQGGCIIDCDPGIFQLAQMVTDGNTRSDAVGTALFITRIAQLVFKGESGMDELIQALKAARGDKESLITII